MKKILLLGLVALILIGAVSYINESRTLSPLEKGFTDSLNALGFDVTIQKESPWELFVDDVENVLDNIFG